MPAVRAGVTDLTKLAQIRRNSLRCAAILSRVWSLFRALRCVHDVPPAHGIEAHTKTFCPTFFCTRARALSTKAEPCLVDTECRLFLVSLKAGGQGLNLTAADYIYILDPWWNPAVEAQAVDRAHRIGQTRRVFAYRLIARDTVEEKIVALQDRKRELAESIVRADETMVSSLTAEDVEMLLS